MSSSRPVSTYACPAWRSSVSATAATAATSAGSTLESMRGYLPATVSCVPFLDPLPAADMELLWRRDRTAPRIQVIIETARKLAARENWAP